MAKTTENTKPEQTTESTENTQLQAVDKSTGEIAVFDPKKVKMKRILNVPVLSQKNEATIYVTMVSKMFVGKPIEGDEVSKEPATIAYVIDLQSNGIRQIILSAMQASVLDEAYPDQSYIDKSFMMINHGKLNGKRYNTVEAVEIDTPAHVNTAAARSLIVVPDTEA